MGLWTTGGISRSCMLILPRMAATCLLSNYTHNYHIPYLARSSYNLTIRYYPSMLTEQSSNPIWLSSTHQRIISYSLMCRRKRTHLRIRLERLMPLVRNLCPRIRGLDKSKDSLQNQMMLYSNQLNLRLNQETSRM